MGLAAALAGGALVTGVLTWLLLRWVRWVGCRWGADVPDGSRKSHKERISRLGGLPIFVVFAAAFGIAAWSGAEMPREWEAILLGGGLFFAIGFVDDLRPLGAKVKLLSQLAAACAVVGAGMQIEILSNPLAAGGAFVLPPALAVAVTVLWLVALPNLINLIDGMDGLASGISLFLCLTLGAIAATSGNFAAAAVAFAMAGAALGFLAFNFPPARIFLGDGGAYLLGAYVATGSLASSNKGSIIAVLLVVMVALGLPVLDTAFAIVRRGLRGVPLFRADAEHLHHRLLTLGFSKNTALFSMYAVCLILSLAGLSILWTRGQSIPIALAVFFIVMLIAARGLGYVESFRDIRRQIGRAYRQRRQMQFAALMGDILELEADRCRTPNEFWRVFDLGLARIELARWNDDDHQNDAAVDRIAVKLADGAEWVVAAPANQPERRWRHLAACFHPAYARGLAKWGTPGNAELRNAETRKLEDSDAPHGAIPAVGNAES